MKTLKISIISFALIVFACFNLSAQCTDYATGCNLDFTADNPPSFNGWTARIGSYQNSTDDSPNFNWNITGSSSYSGTTYGIFSNPATATSNSGRMFVINTNPNETDSRTSNALKKIPTGFTRSVQIANSDGGGDCSEMYYTLNVTSDNCLVTFCYAMVLETPHENRHYVNPTFEVDIVDLSGNRVKDCLFFQMCGDNGSTVTLDSSWHTVGSWIYCSWKQIKISLADFDGETVQIRARMSDCAWTAHGGYGYFAARAEAPSITVAGCAGEGNVVTTATAPDGFREYEWFECPYQTTDQTQLTTFYQTAVNNNSIVGTNRILTVTSAMMGTSDKKYYAVKLTSPTEHPSWVTTTAPAACITFIPATVNDMRPRFESQETNRYIEVDPENPDNEIGFRFADVQPRNDNFQIDYQVMAFGDGDTVEFKKNNETNNWQADETTHTLADNHTRIDTNATGNINIVYHTYEAGDYIYNRTAHVTAPDGTECEKSDTLNIHVPIRPSFEFQVAHDTICTGHDVVIDIVSQDAAADSYVYEWWWGADDVNAVQPFHQGTSLTIENVDKDTTVHVRAKNPDGNSYRWAYKTIYIEGFPEVVMKQNGKIIDDHTAMICIGENVTLSASDESGNTKKMRWTYNRPVSGSTVGQGTNPAIFNDPITQDTTLYIYAETSQGCFAADSVFVNVVIPSVSASVKRICPGQQVVLTGSDAYTYSWTSSPMDENLDTNKSTEPITVMPDTTTTYTMSGYGENGCHSEVNITITVIPYPIIKMEINPGYVDMDDPIVMFTDVSSYSATSHWTFSDGGSMDGKSVSYKFNDLTKDTVGIHLESSNALGCMTSADTTLPIELFSVWLPTGFTPDGDGINDKFFFMTENDLNDVSFEVFDRWGTKLFSYKAAHYVYGGIGDVDALGWDGTKDGGDVVQNGVYVWRLQYKRKGSTRVYDRQGSIALVR